jgi:uncharacterized membrane protein
MPGAITQETAGLLSAFGRALPVFGTTPAGRWSGEVDLRRAVTVRQPIGRVFAAFARFTRWPDLMPHLYRVEDLGFGLSRWQARGPAGLAVGWTARLTRYIPNELIAWRSEAGSTVPISGSIRFERSGPDRTRVLVRLSCRLPGGCLGRFLAWVFGTDLESALDEELERLKQWMEAEPPAALGPTVRTTGVS